MFQCYAKNMHLQLQTNMPMAVCFKNVWNQAETIVYQTLITQSMNKSININLHEHLYQCSCFLSPQRMQGVDAAIKQAPIIEHSMKYV